MEVPLRILILEDNPIDAELVQFELQEAGLIFTSKVVMTEKDFIRELHGYCPDLILSDYDLPQYNGALALAKARKICPDTPFILVTGAVSEDRAIEILTQGAKDYVLKTRLQQRLVPAVRRALLEAEEHRALKQAEDELRDAHRTLEERVKIRTAELQAEIVARKRLEEELRESEEKYRVLFEGSTHGILAADIETKRFVFANPSICKMFGYSERELLQLSIAALHPEHTLDYVMSEFDSLALSKKPLSAELLCLRKDGTVFYADIAGSNTIVHGRRCTVGFFSDVTARTRAKDDLQISEKRLREAQRIARMGYLDWDVVTNTIKWSEETYRIYGYDPETFAPTIESTMQMLHPGDRERVVQYMSSAIRGESTYDIQHHMIRPDGRVIQVHARGEVTRDVRGNPLRMLGTIIDITESKETEEAKRDREQDF